jgi:hypothetical protein
MDTDRFLARAAEAKRESEYVAFRDHFDPRAEDDWIELIKDLAAIANSGGGVVVIGVNSDGANSGADVRPVLALDRPAIANRVAGYVGERFDDFEVHEVKRSGASAAAIVVGPAAPAPLVFARAATHEDPRGRSRTVFPRGSLYVRHGGRSEPATGADLRGFIERRLDQQRADWLGGIERVLTAPQGAEIVAIERSDDEEGEPTRIRITTDEDAPVYSRINPDATHPHRQKELLAEINRKLPGNVKVNAHDILSVRRVHEIDETTRPEFAHRPKFGSVQYSDELVEWIVDQYTSDQDFFSKARERYYELRHPRRA